MKTIIVPVDFSEPSIDAAFYAADMAMYLQAGIALLHVLPLPLTIPEVPLPSDSYEISLVESNQSLADLKRELENYTNDKLCITHRSTTNSFLSEIKNFNEEKDIFAVVMGTSGGGRAEAFFLGSFSITAAKHLKHPLIIVPPNCIFKVIKKIGLASDMINVTEHIPIKGIRTLFEHFDAKLEILYVSKPSEKMFPEVLRESKFIQINLARYHPAIRITTNDNVKEGLEEFVRKHDIDLLLLLPKERNFVENIFHKSVSKRMVLHPKVPVMILHN